MQNIFSISTEADFTHACLETFRRQAVECEPYARYLSYLGAEVRAVNSVEQIPFLPIEFFKTEKIVCGGAEQQVTFTSSGTTGTETSSHYVTDVKLYEESLTRGFEHFYGSVEHYCVLALLPGYMERQGSSLIYMVESLVKQSKHPQSGFYLYNHEELVKTLGDLRQKNQPTLLIGVTFALLDLVEGGGVQRGVSPAGGGAQRAGVEDGVMPNAARFDKPARLRHLGGLSMTTREVGENDSWLTIMETGGMKGRRRELPREEMHQILCAKFGVSAIHSEYGMTELLSQAYSAGNGKFFTPPWMRILLRDLYNPFAQAPLGTSGGVNVVDLANQNSCSFIETQDLGKIYPARDFEILGRIDKSQLRGCNMLV